MLRWIPGRPARLLPLLLGVLLVSLPGPASAPASAGTACNGVTYDQVKGPRPGYGARDLRTYPVRDLTCRAYFLPSMDAGFVPQGVVSDGSTVWVSGYTDAPDVADQFCRLIRIEKSSGRVLGNVGVLVGRAGSSAPTRCRHGGGLSIYGGKLWISEKDRLWLIDPARYARGQNPVLRMWRIHRPVFGSSVVVTLGRIGLLEFRRGGKPGLLAWFTVKDVTRAGVTDIGDHRDRTHAAPTGTQRTVAYAQGSTPWSGHGLLITRTWTGCGQLALLDKTPPADDTLVGLVPSIQGIHLITGNRLWLASEASAKPYNGTRALVHMVSELDASRTLALTGHGSCP